jgi:hypothetical protein
MTDIVEAILQGVTAIWTFVVSTFVPASASDVTLVHLGLWAPMLMGIMFSFLSLVRRGGGGRR